MRHAPYPIKTPLHRLQGQHPITEQGGAAALGTVPAYVTINVTVDNEPAASRRPWGLAAPLPGQRKEETGTNPHP